MLGLVSAGLGVALVPDLILAAAHTSDVATLSLTPASRRQIHAVTTDDLQRVPAVQGHARRARGERAQPVLRPGLNHPRCLASCPPAPCRACQAPVHRRSPQGGHLDRPVVALPDGDVAGRSVR